MIKNTLTKSVTLVAVTTVMALTANANAATEVIYGFNAPTLTPVANQWYQRDTQNGGTATVVPTAGEPASLVAGHANGAAKLTTTSSGSSRADVATYGSFGSATTFLTTAQLAYDYYKQTNAGNSAVVAPALKIAVFAPGGTGDNYGQLIYEPYWNGANPTPDVWATESITTATGGGNDATGGWWWNGGFEQPNGFGGGLMKSLAEWNAAFTLSDPTDFANATVTTIGMGIGTNNPGEINYFDNVRVNTGAIDVTYDFAAVPEPASIGLLGVAAMGLLARRRKAV